MDQSVFLNGNIVPGNQANVSVFDRGFLFGDGIYEVVPVIDRTLLNWNSFRDRLSYSLDQLQLTCPYHERELRDIFEKLLQINQIIEGIVYLQITRGIAEREFAFPDAIKPTVLAFTQQKHIVNHPGASHGVSVCTVPDLRWKRRDIKSIALLAQCVAKTEASKSGAFEAWMTDGETVTEGASSSAFIVTDDTVITRPLSGQILPGIRRKKLLEICAANDISFQERAFTVSEALHANEALLSSASTFVLPIVSINGQQIADGKPGPLTQRLRTLLLEQAQREAGPPA